MMLSSFSLSSPNPAIIKVDKATSELLISPDWSINMEICDAINSSQWVAKEVIKALKKRLQNKRPKVQMLTLTLLETIVKNCDDRIHFHIAGRKVLDDMIKIVKRRGDLQVRLKILVLIDSWQDAFGGPSGKFIHYYLAYDELKRKGVQFPQRQFATPPIVTPPASQKSSTKRRDRLDDITSRDSQGLSISSLKSIQNGVELLADMLQAINPNDQMLVKDEVIVELVEQCHTNKRRLMQMITATRDEQLLSQGIELHDVLQVLLEKHDAIASGSTLPPHLLSSRAPFRPPTVKSGALSRDTMKGRVVVDKDDEEEEFIQLPRRISRLSRAITKSESSSSSNESSSSANSTTRKSTNPNNALVPVDHTEPVTPTTSKGQDMVDFLSIVLSSTSFTPDPKPNNQAQPQVSTHQPQPFQNYVAPWAQVQTYATSNPQDNGSYMMTMQANNSPRPNVETLKTTLPTQQMQAHCSSHWPLVQQTSPTYNTLPPWASTPGYPNNLQSYTYQTQQVMNIGGGIHPLHLEKSTMQLQQSMNPSTATMSAHSLGSMNSTLSQGQKPYLPSYRLFEDLNVFGNVQGKMKSNPYPSAPCSSMIGGTRCSR